ncbi:MAG: flagellar export protein FliJ [bacterium]|nr:flagellar export protein FliJ [bacterium]
MKKFQYRLESLLKLKEHKEKERQKELAISSHKVKRQEMDLETIDGNQRNAIDSQARRLAGKFSVSDMLIYGRYLLKLKRENLTGNEMLRVLKKDEDQKREELLQASRARRVYEKLKEKQQAAFYSEVNSAEQKESDEIAVTNFRRNSH